MANKIWNGSVSTAWATAGNWTPSGVPVNADNVYLTQNAINIASYDGSAVTLATLNIDKSYTGSIGEAGTYLKIGSAITNIGLPTVDGSGTGSRHLNLNISSNSAVVNHFSSGQTTDTPGSTPTRLILSGTGAVLNALGGTLGVALDPGETSGITLLTMTSGSPSVTLGAGVTLATANQYTGVLNNKSAQTMTAVYALGKSAYNYSGTGAHTLLQVANKSAFAGSGTVATLTVFGSGNIDFSGGNVALTVTNATVYAGGTCVDSNHRVTWTNGVITSGCTIDDVTLNLGVNLKVNVS